MVDLILKLKINEASSDGPHAVDGLPSDQSALVMRIQGRWRLLRTIGDISGGWTGSFDTPSDALAALEAEVLGGD